MLTQSYLQEIFDYLPNGDLVWKINKGRHPSKGKIAGSLNPNGYKYLCLDYKTILHHRIVFMLHHGYMPSFVDHINGIRDDNRIENLRAATRCQNGANQKIAVDNKSGYKGVSWASSKKRWRANVIVNGKSVFSKYYRTLEEAALAYNKAAIEHHGEFARLNKIAETA